MGTPFCGKGELNQVIRVGHATPAYRFRDIAVFGGTNHEKLFFHVERNDFNALESGESESVFSAEQPILPASTANYVKSERSSRHMPR